MGSSKLILGCLDKVPIKFDEFVNKIYENSEDNPNLSQSKYDLDEVNRKMKRAILYIISQKEYYGSLIPHLNIYGCENRPKFKTMCTDGSSIIFHPEFVLKQSMEALRMVLAHEIMHCVGDHMDRRGNRNPDLWNVATDYSINPLLNGEPGFEWPKNDDGSRMGLYEEKYEGMRAEDIYDDLLKQYPNGKVPEKIQKQADMGEVVDSDTELPGPEPGTEVQRSVDADPIGDETENGENGENLENGENGTEAGDPGGDEDGKEGPSNGESGRTSKDEPGKDVEKPKDENLPKAGQKVLLNDGTEGIIKKVYPNGDIEI